MQTFKADIEEIRRRAMEKMDDGAVTASYKADVERVVSVLNEVLRPFQYPAGDGKTATEFGIDPARFQEAFAVDLPIEQTAIMAATQRPISELAFSEPNGPPAWKSLPSWAVVATGDKAIGHDLVQSMAERSGATITEVEGSHVIMISQPGIVADVITTAAAAVDRATVTAGG